MAALSLRSAILNRGLATSATVTAPSNLNEVVIASTARTPIGSFRSSLASLPAPRMGALAITEALRRAGCPADAVDEVLMGSVLPAAMGQAPDRQAAIFAGIPQSVPCTMVNKVCASGMKTIMLGAQSLALGQSSVVVAGGFESMSNVPFYQVRGETPYGGFKLHDGLVYDGLTDVYNKFHMGNCGEETARKLGIDREAQDEYALGSYRRAAEAYSGGSIQAEMFDVEVPAKRKGKPPTVVKEDEEYKNVNPEKFKKLATVFQREGGTVTAGNASTLSDGAAACVLMTAEAAEKMGCKPLARIVGYADGATDPVDFPIAPKFAVDKLLKQTGMNAQQVDLWEINEAFSVVVLANMKLSELDPAKVCRCMTGGKSGVSSGCPLSFDTIFCLVYFGIFASLPVCQPNFPLPKQNLVCRRSNKIET